MTVPPRLREHLTDAGNAKTAYTEEEARAELAAKRAAMSKNQRKRSRLNVYECSACVAAGKRPRSWHLGRKPNANNVARRKPDVMDWPPSSG